MTILAENKHTEAFLISEAPHMRSRDRATILAGSGSARVLTAGMVVGKRLSGDAVATADAGNSGTGAMGAITVTGAAKPGVHRLIIIEPGANVGTFVIFDPDGIPGPKGAVASAYSARGLAFTLADATDFVAGDGFNIEVTKSAEKWLQLDLTAATGEAEAAGILRDDITAANGTDNPDGAIFNMDCEVTAAELVWPAGITAAQIALATVQFNRLGIKLR